MGHTKFRTLIATCTAAFLTCSCATIVSDRTYPVALSSTPTGANFVVLNEAGTEVHAGITPYTVNLRSGSGYFSSAGYRIRFDHEDYPSREIELRATMDGWYWGNILFGGLIGMLIVDPITGSMWKLPKELSVNLDGERLTDAKAGELTLLTLSQVPDELKKELIPLSSK